MPKETFKGIPFPLDRLLALSLFILQFFPALIFGLIFKDSIETYFGIEPWKGIERVGTALEVLLFSFVCVRFVDRRPLGSLGLRLDRPAIRDFGIGVLISALQMGIIFGLYLRMGRIHIKKCSWYPGFFLRALCYWPGGAMLEELLFRGYAFQCLLRLGGRRFGPNLALSVTSLLFGCTHETSRLIESLSLTIGGLELGVAYLVTRRLWSPFAMHLSWNVIQGPILGFPVSGGRFFSYLKIEQVGPKYWTGGEFGPEGNPIAVVISLLGIVLLLYLSHRAYWRPDPYPRDLEFKETRPDDRSTPISTN